MINRAIKDIWQEHPDIDFILLQDGRCITISSDCAIVRVNVENWDNPPNEDYKSGELFYMDLNYVEEANHLIPMDNLFRGHKPLFNVHKLKVSANEDGSYCLSIYFITDQKMQLRCEGAPNE